MRVVGKLGCVLDDIVSGFGLEGEKLEPITIDLLGL